MRVLVIGPPQPDQFADNVHIALTDLGHRATISGPARPLYRPTRLANALGLASEYAPRLDARQQSHHLRVAKEFVPDLTIVVDSRLNSEVVARLRNHCDRIVLWFPDHVANLGRHRMLLAPYDRLYFKVPMLVEQLRDLHGLPASYLPEACNPRWHRSDLDYGTEPTFVVAGNMHPTRALLVERLLDAGMPLSIYGPPMSSWLEFPRIRAAHKGGSIVRQEKADIFRSSLGVLNNLHPGELMGSNCRLFEATGSGGLTLTEWRSGMEELFVAGQEVLTFDSFDVLVGHCRDAVADPLRARSIADAGARRSQSEHTYATRLEAMFHDLGMS